MITSIQSLSLSLSLVFLLSFENYFCVISRSRQNILIRDRGLKLNRFQYNLYIFSMNKCQSNYKISNLVQKKKDEIRGTTMLKLNMPIVIISYQRDKGREREREREKELR